MTLAKLSKISLAALIMISASSAATVVEFTTSHGNFKVNLHDETTPITVNNFLNYINDGDYNNTVIHRLVPGFVMQSGGFEFTGDFPLTPIATDAAIKNEPLYSNVRGTIAMAKLSGNENSATSQWFVNLSNNSGGGAALDSQNGGFTVFGEIIEGLDNIDTIATLNLCNDVPMPNYTTEQCADANFVPGAENFVIIESVVITDATVNTASSLAAVKNTSLTPNKSSDSSGGPVSWLSILLTGLLAFRKRFS